LKSRELFVSTDSGDTFHEKQAPEGFPKVNFGLVDCADQTEIRAASGQPGDLYIATGEGFTAGSAGKVMGESYTGFSWFGPFLMGYERCAAIKAEPGDTILARYSDGSGVAAVMREVDGVLEIANGAPGGFSPAFFRNAARALGAQILNERDDVVVFAESGVLSVFCDRGGDIEVNIPAGQKIVSCITGKEYEVRNGKLKFHSFDGETTWFKLAKCK